MNPWWLLAAIPVFGLLVLVHELGHFLTAKWADIRVDEFAIGFPPRLFGVKRGETMYSLNLLPLGGYVRMPGENGESTDESGAYDPRTFAAKPASKRLVVLLAGVTMNVLLAFVLLATAEAIGQPDPDKLPAVIDKVTAGSPAEHAGIKPGDRILSVNGKATQYYIEFKNAVSDVTDKTPADTKFVPITVEVQRKGQPQPVSLTVQALAHPGPNEGHFGVTADVSNISGIPYKRVPVWQAPVAAVRDMGTIVTVTVQGVQQILRGQIPWNKAVQGPVGIVQVTGEVASGTPTGGPFPILFLTAFLSLNLAVINALPIPALDGGRVLLIFVELLRRGKRISPEREGLINLIGMGLLLLLMLVVTINDVGNLFH